jgi:GTP-binding protein
MKLRNVRSCLQLSLPFPTSASISASQSWFPLLDSSLKLKVGLADGLSNCNRMHGCRHFHTGGGNADINAMTVALVGRPNVGKSTLFNRLTKSKSAIVSSIPGTTRDRRDGKGALAGLPLNVIDTGGLDDRGQVSEQIQEQVKMALRTADVIAFMVDCKEGVTTLDSHFARWLRKNAGIAAQAQLPTRKPSIIILANKAEGGYQSSALTNAVDEASRLGFGNPIPISASHGDGLADLYTVLLELAQNKGFKDEFQDTSVRSKTPKISNLIVHGHSQPNEEAITSTQPDAKSTTRRHNKIPVNERTIQMAVMGKPNVGKSTFINSLLEANRLIAGPTPGLTRDSIHIDWIFKERQFVLVDTAGLTKITVDSRQINNTEEMKRIRQAEASGKAVDRLPGVEVFFLS